MGYIYCDHFYAFLYKMRKFRYFPGIQYEFTYPIMLNKLRIKEHAKNLIFVSLGRGES